MLRHAAGETPLVVEAGALDRLDALIAHHLPGHRPIAILDATVARLHPDLLAGAPHLLLPSGEEHKTRASWSRLSDELLALGADRRSAIVAIGGGVTTDLGGFVAATYLRGIPWIAVPTTTLAMCDAAIGGKTGVDTPHGKNLIGAFHQPRAVVADPRVLASLPEGTYREGLVEAVKHAAIADGDLFGWLERELASVLARDEAALEQLLRCSMAIKAAVVSADEREGGRRAILNAGHTIAHAAEHASDYRLSHGAAVAIGLVLESRIGERLALTEPGTSDRLATLLGRMDLPILLPEGLDPQAFRAALALDKKNRDGTVRAALIARIGAMAGSDAAGWTSILPLEMVNQPS
ncbi:MAG: 3-dehydroquinate synthase [Gemmatimonadetes bacterium]|nr:3-dehydroquinate synthase [Gemmatimonadota bacterium]